MIGRALHWRLPRTLYARVALILVIGLAITQGASFWLTLTERDNATTDVMMGYVEREVASSVALLDHLPANERAAWLPRLARRTYRFILGPGETGAPPDARLSARMAKSIEAGIGRKYAVSVNTIPDTREHLQVHLKLTDGAPLTIDVLPMSSIPISPWLPFTLALQLAVIAACSWLAVRLATRPLQQLAKAADALGPDLKGERLPEKGPSEVARAARAFNSMQERIAGYMAERIQILAAISHDLQTPITRMRLRVETMDDEVQGTRLQRDLAEMETLVKEGLAYARTMHGVPEDIHRTDLHALLESLVYDYVDAGAAVSLDAYESVTISTLPNALRRLIGNLVDNALKFAGQAAIEMRRDHADSVVISVLDRGPGISPEALEAVFQPFYREETSRNRATGGTGLGLAIARQLAVTLNATLTLENREGGGLEARVVLNAA